MRERGREKKSAKGRVKAALMVRGVRVVTGSGAHQVMATAGSISRATRRNTVGQGRWSESASAPMPETSMAMR